VRTAINPLQWFLAGGVPFPDGLDGVMAEVAAAGFTAIHTAIPDGESVQRYRERLRRHGLRAAPGYVTAALHEPDARPEFLERARRDAAQHAELGLTEMFLGCALVAERCRRPARSAEAGPDGGALDVIAHSAQLLGAATAAEGVRACLHNHVGSPVESEAELEGVLARADPALVGLGPDTGHLAWAGGDPVGLLARCRDRVGALHLKDVRLAAAERGRAEGLDYGAQVRLGLWAELGAGDLPLLDCLRALGESPAWVVVEVDHPTAATPLESARTCADWLRAQPLEL
jgi:inosose dehydratase